MILVRPAADEVLQVTVTLLANGQPIADATTTATITGRRAWLRRT